MNTSLAVRSAVVASVLALAAPALGAPRSQTQTPSRCDGVRPGAHIVTSEGSGGTLNFLFRGSDGARYVATAGHLLADEERHIWRADNGPTAQIDDGTLIGRAVYASNFNGEDDDFALIRVTSGVGASPSMCHWGGPTGINNEKTAEPTVLRLYGAGMGIREATPERTLVAPRMTNPSLVAAIGVAVPGDSGSPVISDDGRALGMQYILGVIWGGTPGTNAFTPGNVGILRLGPQVRRAERALGMSLKLMTAPRTEPQV